MKSKTSIGIYFEDGKLDLVAVARSLRSTAVKGALSLSIAQGEEGREGALKGIEDFIKECGASKGDIYAALPRSEVILTRLAMPSPTEENLTEAVGYELDRNTPYSREDTYFDSTIIGRDIEGKSIDVLQATILRKKLDPCLEILKETTSRPVSFELSSSAAANAFFCDSAKRAGRYIFALFSPEGFELIMIEEGAFNYSRYFHIEEAGRALILTERLIEELRGIIKLSGWNERSVDGIVLDKCSGEGELMAKALEEGTGIRCTLRDALPVGLETGDNSASFIVAYGLALRGVEDSVAPLNFLSQTDHSRPKKVRYSSALPFVAAVLLFVLAAILAPLLFRYSKLKSIEAEIGNLLEDVNYIEGIKREIVEKESRLDQLTGSSDRDAGVLNLIKELTRIMPIDTWVTNFVYKSGRVELTGYSKSASSCIPIIERSPYFKGVEFSAPVTTVDRTSVVRGFASKSALSMNKGLVGKGGGGSLEQFMIRAFEEKKL